MVKVDADLRGICDVLLWNTWLARELRRDDVGLIVLTDPLRHLKFVKVLRECVRMAQVPEASPKSQVFHLFWCRALHILFEKDLAGVVRPLTEYIIRSGASFVRADYAGAFGFDNNFLPLLVGKAARNPLALIHSTPGGFLHKDLEALLDSGSLLSILCIHVLSRASL